VLQSQIRSGGLTQQAKYEQSKKTLNALDRGQLVEKLQKIPLFHVAGTKVNQFLNWTINSGHHLVNYSQIFKKETFWTHFLRKKRLSHSQCYYLSVKILPLLTLREEWPIIVHFSFAKNAFSSSEANLRPAIFSEIEVDN